MSRKYKIARQINKLKVIEAAEKLGISQPTLSAWEGERKSPSIESLENMADLYDVTTDYLLGRTEMYPKDQFQPIVPQVLRTLHGIPVWSAIHGWMLVNAIEQRFILPTGETLPFADMGDIFISPPPFACSILPHEQPLTKFELTKHTKIWVEPISLDCGLRDELRGWYSVKDRWVENEYGNRFYFDTYCAKWLAFSDVFSNK